MKWARWYRGTTENPKFKLASRMSNALVTEALALWSVMFEDATHKEHWGVVKKDADFMSVVLDLPAERAQSLINSFAELGMVVITENGIKILKWNDYQHTSDHDPTRAERQRRHYNAHKTHHRRNPNALGPCPDTDLEEERKKEAASAALSLDGELFKRGKEVVGENGGGLIAKLKKHHRGNVALARATVEMASTKQDPKEYVCAVLKGGSPSEGGKRLTADEEYWGVGRIPGGCLMPSKVVDISAGIQIPVFRHGQPGYFSLADLPQRGSVEQQAFGSGWWELDQIFKFYLGQFVVVTGIAGHGKSTFLLNVLLKMARERGVKSFMYVPENEAYLHDKLSKLWGNDETFEHFSENQCFVQSAIPDHYDAQPKTIDWVLDRAATAVQRDNVEIVLIDPWNELERAKPREQLLTDYIGECLMLLKQFCRSLNVVVIIVAHPTKAVNENGGRIAGLADIEGSMNWFNKCDNGLIVVRNPQLNTAKVISAKVREIGAGKIGACHFYVDANTGIFTPQHGAVDV